VVLAGDVLVATSITGTIVGLDPATGDQRWTTTASNGHPVDPIVTDGNTVYVLFDNQQSMGAYDSHTGEELWLVAPPGEGVRRFGGLPLAESDAIFIAGADALLALGR
jgi:FOG: WD40-like repeat